MAVGLAAGGGDGEGTGEAATRATVGTTVAATVGSAVGAEPVKPAEPDPELVFAEKLLKDANVVVDFRNATGSAGRDDPKVWKL